MKEKLIKVIYCDIQEFDEYPDHLAVERGMSLSGYNIEGIDESELDEKLEDNFYYKSLDILKDILIERYKNAAEYYIKKAEWASKIEEKDLYQDESYKEYLKSKLKAV